LTGGVTAQDRGHVMSVLPYFREQIIKRFVLGSGSPSLYSFMPFLFASLAAVVVVFVFLGGQL